MRTEDLHETRSSGVSTQRWRWMLALLTVLAMVISACGPEATDEDEPSDDTSATETTAVEEPAGVDDDDGDTDSDSEGTDSDSEDTADAAGELEGVLRIAIPQVVNTLDLAVYEGAASTDVETMWSSALFRWSRDLPPDQLPSIEDVEPFLAESYEILDDGRIQVELGDYVSPFGNPLTSEDVLWTWQRQAELDFVSQFILSVGFIPGEDPIEIIDDSTFIVNVTEPNPFTLAAISLYTLAPLDSTEAQAHATDDDPWAQEWLSENSATFGPYVVEEFTPAESVTLGLNPNWTGEEPDATQVLVRTIPEPATRLQLVQAGEMDIAVYLQPDQFGFAQDDPNVVTVQRPSPAHVHISPNYSVEPFDDPRVRRAMALGLDREALVEGPMYGFSEPLQTMLSASLTQPEAPEEYTYDPEEARRLLAEAGVEEGFSATLSYYPGRPGPYAEDLAVQIQSMYQEIGINFDIQLIASSAEFEAAKREDGMEVWIDRNTPILPDAWYHFQLDHHSTQAFQNHKGYANEQVDELLGQLHTLQPGPERDEVLVEIHGILMEEAAYIPLVEEITLVALSDRVDPESYRHYIPLGPEIFDLDLQ